MPGTTPKHRTLKWASLPLVALALILIGTHGDPKTLRDLTHEAGRTLAQTQWLQSPPLATPHVKTAPPIAP